MFFNNANLDEEIENNISDNKENFFNNTPNNSVHKTPNPGGRINNINTDKKNLFGNKDNLKIRHKSKEKEKNAPRTKEPNININKIDPEKEIDDKLINNFFNNDEEEEDHLQKLNLNPTPIYKPTPFRPHKPKYAINKKKTEKSNNNASQNAPTPKPMAKTSKNQEINHNIDYLNGEDLDIVNQGETEENTTKEKEKGKSKKRSFKRRKNRCNFRKK